MNDEIRSLCICLFEFNFLENINAYTIALVTMYHSNGGSILGKKKTKAVLGKIIISLILDKNNKEMIKSIITWLGKAILVLLAKVLVFITAPLLALPIFVTLKEEQTVTGFPSLIPGTKREFLIKPLRWAQTHDAPVDEYGIGAYHTRDNSKLHEWAKKIGIEKYYYRVKWLQRNSAYDFAERLGMRQDGLEINYNRTSNTWRTPSTGFDLQTATNSLGQRGFMLRGQFRIWFNKYMEYRFGYALQRASPIRNRAMLYIRVFKIRSY